MSNTAPPAFPPSGWKSPDTYFQLLSALISSLVLVEVFAPGSTAAKVVGCLALTLQFLGYSNARAQIRAASGSSSSGQAGFFRLDVACAILLVGAIAVGAISTGCKALGSGKDVARAGAALAVDCGSKAAQDALKQYGPTVEQLYESATTPDGKLDQATFEQATSGFLAETGWCVAENVLARILSHVPLPGAPQASPLQLDAGDAKRVLGAIREARYPGVTFKPAASSP